MGKLLDLKLNLDHRLIATINQIKSVQASRLSREEKQVLSRTHERWANRAEKQKCLICGNGPSLNELKFKDFTGIPSFAANYFYKHAEAKVLNPEFYTIIDGKVATGIWPISMIDDIFETLPETNLFLNVRWLSLPQFARFKNHPKIFWILPILLSNAYLKPRTRLDRPVIGSNVVVASICLATAIGFGDIGIAGVDGDGLFREILDMQSHFYEADKDHSMRDFESMVKSLTLSSSSLWAWNGFVKKHAHHGVQLQNLCRGGIMDCMPRVSPEKFLE